jgi:hypothetical protein
VNSVCKELSQIDWGSVPDWIAGVGSLLAFLAFGVAFVWETRKRREDLHAVAVQQRRGQAERITYFLEDGRAISDGMRTPVDAADFHHAEESYARGVLNIVNNSESCVYELVASAPALPGDLDLRGIGVIPPGLTRVVMPMNDMMEGGSASWRRVGDYANSKLVPWVQFKDHAGVAWRRSNKGGLEELASPVPFPDYSP